MNFEQGKRCSSYEDFANVNGLGNGGMRRCNSAAGNASFERIAKSNQCGDNEMLPADSSRGRSPTDKSGGNTRRKGRRPSFFLRANSGKIKEDQEKEEPQTPSKNSEKGKRTKEEDDKARSRNKNSKLLNLKRNFSAERAPESHRISRMFGRLEAGPPQLSSSFRFRIQNGKEVPVKKSGCCESDVSGTLIYDFVNLFVALENGAILVSARIMSYPFHQLGMVFSSNNEFY